MAADIKALKKTIGRRIAVARTYRGITQTELAEVLGKHPVTISKWETGIQTPDGDTIYNMCLYLGISADFILGLSDDLGGRNAQV